jgi:hypothetical protein
VAVLAMLEVLEAIPEETPMFIQEKAEVVVLEVAVPIQIVAVVNNMELAG